MLSRLKIALRALLRRSQAESELDEELRYHIELQTEQNIRLGMNPEEAHIAARKAFGGVEQAKERSRDARAVRWIEELWQDLRYGARMLMKNPGFTLTAVITLALGIGANTAIFSIVKTVLIRPLPFDQPDRLAQPRYRTQARLGQGDWQSWIDRRDLVDWRARSHSFERIGGYRTNAALFLPGEGTPEVIKGVSVTPDVLPALGVQPALGRLFLAEESKPSGGRPIILSDDLWRRRFGADPGTIGQTIRAIGAIYVVVGVMPPGFDFPLKQRLDVVRGASKHAGFWTLAFTLAVTVFAGLIFGALPAWRSARVNLNETLKQAAGRSGAWRSSMRAPGNMLVTVEIALALTLTLGAGLLLNSFARLMAVDPGLRANGVMAAVIEPNPALFRQVMERLEATPGVVAAGASNGLPFTEHGNAAYIKVEGQPLTPVSDPATLTTLHIVSGNYLRALDVPVLKGRPLDATDTARSLPVALINETAARRFWNGANPIGKRLSFSRPGEPEVWRRIVGVVKSTHQQGIEKAIRPEVYVPVEQAPYPLAMLFVRASLPKADLARNIRQAVAVVNKNVPVHNIISMEELLSDSVSAQRFTMSLLVGFSALALTLAMMGVYGVVSYMVRRRAPEIGVRIALGAQGGDVLRLIVAQGFKPVIIGSVTGLMASLALNRALSSLLYGVTATDPVTFAIVVFLLLLAAMLACYLPARRATKVDPMIALRAE